jgi:hypothetical protein
MVLDATSSFARDSNLKLAGPALEKVVVAPGLEWTHRAFLFFHDPTGGALIVAPEYRAKVEAAFPCTVSGIALSQQHVSLGLYPGKLLIQAKLVGAELLLKRVYRHYECVFRRHALPPDYRRQLLGVADQRSGSSRLPKVS